MVKECRPLEIGKEYFDSHPFISALVAQGSRPYMVHIEAAQDISNANFEFTHNGSAAALTHLRVETTGSYSKVDIISASANDDSSAAAHTQKVKVWGVDEDNKLRVEEISVNGATAQSSTKSYFEIGEMYASQFGTGGKDAAGNIDVGYTGKVTEELLRMDAATRVARSSRVIIPKSWRAKILSVNVYPQDSDVGISSGVMVYPHYYDELESSEEDSTFGKVSVMRDGAQFNEAQWPRIYGNDTTYSCLEFLGNRIKNSETWMISARVVIWPTSACSSNRRQIYGDV